MAFSVNALLFLLVHPAAVFADQRNKGVCRDNREEFGFALLGHDYKTLQADNFGRCFFVCSSEEKCQSATFLLITKECQLKKERKISRPGDFVVNRAATYMENPFRARKGSKASVPGSSCQDILTSGDAQGDGEYWIDPAASGDPFTVFCDMATDGGGWVLVHRFLMNTLDSLKDPKVQSDSYKEILPKYSYNNHYLLRDGLNQLKQDMGFTQIRFHCYKKKRNRVFHITTSKNTKGANVVKYFTSSNTFPKACDSFTRLPGDTSSLAEKCDKWGYPNENYWGHPNYLGNDRIYKRPLLWAYNAYFRTTGSIYQCDDDNRAMSIGDVFHIFVR